MMSISNISRRYIQIGACVRAIRPMAYAVPVTPIVATACDVVNGAGMPCVAVNCHVWSRYHNAFGDVHGRYGDERKQQPNHP